MQYQDENNTVIDHFPISESIMIALRLLKNCHIKKLRISILEKNKLCSVLTLPNESFSVSTPKENINLKLEKAAYGSCSSSCSRIVRIDPICLSSSLHVQCWIFSIFYCYSSTHIWSNNFVIPWRRQMGHVGCW